MKLVVDIDKISGNLTTLTSSIESYDGSLSTFKSSTIDCSIDEIKGILNEYFNGICNDLDKLSTSSNEYSSLVTECCSEYQSNESNVQNIDVSSINTIIENNPDITTNYSSKDIEEKITTLPSTLLNQITKEKYINVNALKEGTKVYEAYQKYKSELDNCKYCYVDGDHFVVIKEININGVKAYESHIVVNSGSQINGAPANGQYASGLETSTSAAKRLNSLLLINGSHFSGDGSEDLKGTNNIVIVNGQVKTGGTSGGNELLLDKNGNIFISGGQSAEQLVNDGVKYSFACHSTPVIVNGDTGRSYAEGRVYNRTIIAQAGDCEYYVLTDLGGQRLSSSAEYLKSKGCYNAFSLDQGGSVSLDYGSESVYYKGDDGVERPVGDFLYFV